MFLKKRRKGTKWKGKEEKEKGNKGINYLAKNQHSSLFKMGSCLTNTGCLPSKGSGILLIRCQEISEVGDSLASHFLKEGLESLNFLLTL